MVYLPAYHTEGARWLVFRLVTAFALVTNDEPTVLTGVIRLSRRVTLPFRQIPSGSSGSSGRAATHGPLTTAQKLFGESVFLDFMTDSSRATEILRWSTDVSIALVEHFAKLAGREVNEIHVCGLKLKTCSMCYEGFNSFLAWRPLMTTRRRKRQMPRYAPTLFLLDQMCHTRSAKDVVIFSFAVEQVAPTSAFETVVTNTTMDHIISASTSDRSIWEIPVKVSKLKLIHWKLNDFHCDNLSEHDDL